MATISRNFSLPYCQDSAFLVKNVPTPLPGYRCVQQSTAIIAAPSPTKAGFLTLIASEDF